MTMRTLVVVESSFGNTRAVADAVAEGLGGCPVSDVRDTDPGVVADLDLLVVGGPTHAFGMSRERTRADAVEQGATAGDGDGIREWLGRLEPSADLTVATFDTRIDRVRRLPGSAARGAARLLRHHGFRQVLEPVSFYVTGTAGPLADGELARARTWGASLAERPSTHAGG
ncbi:flavodoxin family protein [Nocardioides guangzhouensis]|nr:hypothetical protein [Nocardioides guangzhouensis]